MFKDDNLNFSTAHLKKIAQALLKQREWDSVLFLLPVSRQYLRGFEL